MTPLCTCRLNERTHSVRRRSHIPQLARAVALTLFVGIAVSTVQPAAAVLNSEAKQSISTTRSLSSGYSAEGSGTNPVTTQVTDARAERATSQCSSQRSCPSSSPPRTKQAENAGAGRVKHSHPSAATQPDSTVESSAGRLTVGKTSSGNAPDNAAASQSSVTYPILTIGGNITYRRTTSAEPDGTGAVTHTLSYKADVPVPEHSQEVDSAWNSFSIASPPAGQRICLGNVALSYDSGGDLDKMTFTHVTEGSANGSISGVSAGTAVTTVVTTTLDVSVLSGSDRDLATSYATTVLLSSGTVNVPAASLSVDDPPSSSASGTFAAVVATKASTKQLVVNGAAITDNGGFDALSGSWSTDKLAKDRKHLASQTH